MGDNPKTTLDILGNDASASEAVKKVIKSLQDLELAAGKVQAKSTASPVSDSTAAIQRQRDEMDKLNDAITRVRENERALSGGDRNGKFNARSKENLDRLAAEHAKTAPERAAAAAAAAEVEAKARAEAKAKQDRVDEARRLAAPPPRNDPRSAENLAALAAQHAATAPQRAAAAAAAAAAVPPLPQARVQYQPRPGQAPLNPPAPPHASAPAGGAPLNPPAPPHASAPAGGASLPFAIDGFALFATVSRVISDIGEMNRELESFQRHIVSVGQAAAGASKQQLLQLSDKAPEEIRAERERMRVEHGFGLEAFADNPLKAFGNMAKEFFTTNPFKASEGGALTEAQKVSESQLRLSEGEQRANISNAIRKGKGDIQIARHEAEGNTDLAIKARRKAARDSEYAKIDSRLQTGQLGYGELAVQFANQLKDQVDEMDYWKNIVAPQPGIGDSIAAAGGGGNVFVPFSANNELPAEEFKGGEGADFGDLTPATDPQMTEQQVELKTQTGLLGSVAEWMQKIHESLQRSGLSPIEIQ